MINRIKIENFKKFKEAEITFSADVTLFVGPNNGGKTTALQAVNLWGFLIQQWDRKKGKGTGSKASTRTGAIITRNELYAIPVREMKLLWHNTKTQGPQSERFDIVITAFGTDDQGSEWEYGIRANYANPQSIYCSPIDVDKPIPDEAFRIFHLPPLSGVQTEEKKLELGAQNLAIGEGRPGEILRNVLLAIRDSGKWEQFAAETQGIFNLKLEDIVFNPVTDANIYVNYSLGETKTLLEISTAGSGFLQFLLLAGFMYTHSNATLLIDEPDSHMHVLLQRGVFDWLKRVSTTTKSQVVISTHSEVLIESTPLEKITAFFASKPNTFQNTNAIKQALRVVGPLEILNAEQKRFVLFAEGSTDLSLLKGFAIACNHKVSEKLQDIFFVPTGNNQIDNARDKFNAYRSLEPDLKGYFIRDKTAVTHQSVIPPELTVKYWSRNEIENYLLIPDVLAEFVAYTGHGGLFAQSDRQKALDYLTENLPPAYMADPLNASFPVKGSDFLEAFFEAMHIPISKSDYWKITVVMKTEDVHPDVTTVLDEVLSAAEDSPGTAQASTTPIDQNE